MSKEVKMDVWRSARLCGLPKASANDGREVASSLRGELWKQKRQGGLDLVLIFNRMAHCLNRVLRDWPSKDEDNLFESI